VKIRIFVASILFASLLGACGTDCKKACDHAALICSDAFAKAGLSFDAKKCADTCSDNLDGCKNMSDQESCVLKAATCPDIKMCPGCIQ
jgi:hypothetical protein